MKVELLLLDRKNSARGPQKFELDLPAIPRKGEVIMIGDTHNCEVRDVIYRFDEEGRFTGRIRVNALSWWNA